MAVIFCASAGLSPTMLQPFSSLTTLTAEELVLWLKARADAELSLAPLPDSAVHTLPTTSVYAEIGLDEIAAAMEISPGEDWIILTCDPGACLAAMVEAGPARSLSAALETWEKGHRLALDSRRSCESHVFLVDVDDPVDSLALIWRHLFGEDAPPQPMQFPSEGRPGVGFAGGLIAMILADAKSVATLNEERAEAILAQNERLQAEALRETIATTAEETATELGIVTPQVRSLLERLSDIKAAVLETMARVDPDGEQLRASPIPEGLEEIVATQMEAKRVAFDLNEISIAVAKLRSAYVEIQLRNDMLCKQAIELIQHNSELEATPKLQSSSAAEEATSELSVQHTLDLVTIQSLTYQIEQIENEVDSLYVKLKQDRDIYGEEVIRLKKLSQPERPSVALIGTEEGHDFKSLTVRVEPIELNSSHRSLSAADFTIRQQDGEQIQIAIAFLVAPAEKESAPLEQRIEILSSEDGVAPIVSCSASTWIVVSRTAEVALDAIRRGDFVRTGGEGDFSLEHWRKIALAIQISWLKTPRGVFFDRVTLRDHYVSPTYEHIELRLHKVYVGGTTLNELNYKISSDQVKIESLSNPSIEVRSLQEGRPLLDAWKLAQTDNFGPYLRVNVSDKPRGALHVSALSEDDAAILLRLAALPIEETAALVADYKSKNRRPFQHWVDLVRSAYGSTAEE